MSAGHGAADRRAGQHPSRPEPPHNTTALTGPIRTSTTTSLALPKPGCGLS